MLVTHCLGASGRCGFGMMLALFVCTKCARPLIASVPLTTREYVLPTTEYEPFTLKDTLLGQADCAAPRSTRCTSTRTPCSLGARVARCLGVRVAHDLGVRGAHHRVCVALLEHGMLITRSRRCVAELLTGAWVVHRPLSLWSDLPAPSRLGAWSFWSCSPAITRLQIQAPR